MPRPMQVTGATQVSQCQVTPAKSIPELYCDNTVSVIQQVQQSGASAVAPY